MAVLQTTKQWDDIAASPDFKAQLADDRKRMAAGTAYGDLRPTIPTTTQPYTKTGPTLTFTPPTDEQKLLPNADPAGRINPATGLPYTEQDVQGIVESPDFRAQLADDRKRIAAGESREDIRPRTPISGSEDTINPATGLPITQEEIGAITESPAFKEQLADDRRPPEPGAPIPTAADISDVALVEDRIAALTESGSPYMQLSDTKVKQSQNALGLLNTSMTAGAIEAARIDKALDIAKADATALNQARALDVTGNQALDQIAASGRVQKDLLALKQVNDIALISAEGDEKAALLKQKSDIDTQLQKLIGSQALAEQGLRGDQATTLKKMESDNKALLQTSASAASIYANGSNAMAEILANKDIPGNKKLGLIKNIQDSMNVGIVAVGGIVGLDLTEFQFDTGDIKPTSVSIILPDGSTKIVDYSSVYDVKYAYPGT